MKIKELIKRLKEVEELEPNSIVYLATRSSIYDFTGLSVDDVCDVELYAAAGDNEA